MKIKQFDTTLIEDSYIIYMNNIILKYNLENILDLSQGSQGRTAFYMYQCLNKYNRNIVTVLDDTAKESVIRQLGISELDGAFIHNMPLVTDGDSNRYDTDWTVYGTRFNFVSVDAPYCADIVNHNARVDILRIIEHGMLDTDKFVIMFHDIDNQDILRTINKAKKMLNCRFISYKKFIILTNIDDIN